MRVQVCIFFLSHYPLNSAATLVQSECLMQLYYNTICVVVSRSSHKARMPHCYLAAVERCGCSLESQPHRCGCGCGFGCVCGGGMEGRFVVVAWREDCSGCHGQVWMWVQASAMCGCTKKKANITVPQNKSVFCGKSAHTRFLSLCSLNGLHLWMG